MGDWQPGSQEQWRCPRSDGLNYTLACWKQAFFRLSSGFLRPDKPSSSKERQRQAATADGSGRVDGGPAQAFRSPPRPFDPRPEGWWRAEIYEEASLLRLGRRGRGARLPSRLPAAAARVGGSSARGLLSQGWPSLFDKLIAWRGLAGPGVTPVNNKGGVGRN